MAEWSRLLPGTAPREVEQARQAVESLKARVPEARQGLEDARRALVEVEKRDREAMATQLQRGKEPTSDTKGVARAREAVEAAQRRSEALTLAIANAEADLGVAAHAHRDPWLKSAQRQERDARERGRKAFDQLTSALHTLGEARAEVAWLSPEGGLDREQACRGTALGWISGSRDHRGEPWAVQPVLDLVAQAVAEPEPPKPPAEPQALQPIQFGSYIAPQ